MAFRGPVNCRAPNGSGAGAGGRPVRCLYPCCSKEDVAMRSIDLSPFRRSSVGFDRMLQLMDDDFSFDECGLPALRHHPYR